MSSRAANQTKTEPFPASATEAEIETPGQAGIPGEAGTSGTADPGGPLASGSGGHGSGDAASVPATGTDAAPGTSEQVRTTSGHTPVMDEPDLRS